MADRLPTLRTATPQEGYDLSVKMARVAVKMTRPDAAVRDSLRPAYAAGADALIASSQVVTTPFETVAATNGHWRETS